MDWMKEVAGRLRRKNQVLFSKDSPYLEDLALLLRGQDRRAAVLWALELAAESVAALEARYPGERRPREALEAAWQWAAGEIKMPIAQRKILDCHALAKELGPREDIAACHAVGQACSVVHTAGHALGYPIYDLTGLVFRLGLEGCRESVEARKRAYLEKLLYWQDHLEDYRGPWAEFLLPAGG